MKTTNTKYYSTQNQIKLNTVIQVKIAPSMQN